MKTTWKWIPVARYHISAAEEWLDKMAARGLLFRKFWGPFAQFEVGEPRPGRRYRLAVDPDYFKRPPESMAELYEQAGWHFAAPIWGRSFFVFYTDDQMAPEPYTDAQSCADSLPQVVRICRWEAQFLTRYLLFDAALIAFAISTLHSMNALPPGLTLPALLSVIPYTLYCFSGIQNLRTVRRMRRWLEEGNSLRSFAPPKSQLAFQSVCWVLILTGFLSTALTFPLDFLNLYRPLVPLEKIPPEMEVLLLSDMEGSGYRPDKFELIHFTSDWAPDYSQVSWAHNNYYQHDLIPLPPTQRTIEQSGKAADGTDIRLNIQRHDLLFKTQAEKLLDTLAYGESCREAAVPGTDRFLISEDGNEIYAALGRRVVEVSYQGDLDFTEYYDEVVDMLQAEK